MKIQPYEVQPFCSARHAQVYLNLWREVCGKRWDGLVGWGDAPFCCRGRRNR